MKCNECIDKQRCRNNHIYDPITNTYRPCPHQELEVAGVPKRWKNSRWEDLPEGKAKEFARKFVKAVMEDKIMKRTYIFRGQWLYTSRYATVIAKSIGKRTFLFENFEDTTHNFFDDKEQYRTTRDNPQLLVLNVKPMMSKALPLVLSDLLESRDLEGKPTLICLAPGDACRDFFETDRFQIYNID